MNIPETQTFNPVERKSRFVLWREGEPDPFTGEMAWGGSDVVCDTEEPDDRLKYARNHVLNAWLKGLDDALSPPEGHARRIDLTTDELRCLVVLARQHVWWDKAAHKLWDLAKSGDVREWLRTLDNNYGTVQARYIALALGIEQWWMQGVGPLELPQNYVPEHSEEDRI